jgi:UPF0755 protein
VALTIKPGISSRAIAELLEDKGLIDRAETLLVWLKLNGRAGGLQAGDYRIAAPVAPRALVDQLGRGSFERAVTIPEGWTARQIAARLAEQKWIASAQVWLDLAARPIDASVLPEAQPEGAEGFCFPETYRFEAGTGGEAILKRMLETFAAQWRAARPDERTEASRDLTLREVVTLASMIQREARVAEEMPLIASVYLNRLKRKMKLQCCATVYYALGEAWDRPLTLKDLEIDNPYNTYRNAGLPPGPIANPGREALEAALRPAESDYLYYVYRGGGHHTFSRTFGEHAAATRAARRTNPDSFVPSQSNGD